MTGPERRHRDLGAGLAWLILAIPYLPLLLTHPGKVGADTKAYLYLDPTRLLKEAPYLWDPKVAMGTVTHQNIGYLLPMGPWFAALHAAAVPIWVAQRLWLGTLLLLAGAGVSCLLQTLGWDRRHTILAALAYELSPYLLLYEARTSAILLPWAGLPWMIALVIRAARADRRRWRDPALFAVVVALVGGTNATSLLFAGLGPALWLPFAVWSHQVKPGRAVATALRIGVLSLGTSLWWIAGLMAQGTYGLNVLKYTETVPAVARTSYPYEMLRGLGNWYFYGLDRVSYWVTPARYLTQTPLVIAASFAIPLLALASAAAVRWRERSYFMLLVAAGLVIGVGVHPYHHPTPLGAAFKAFAQGSSAGLALRTTARAVPLLVLGTAVLLGAGVKALLEKSHGLLHRPPWRLAVPLACAALVAVAQPALWTGGFVESSLDHPETVPAYWAQAAAALTDAGGATRALDLPGADFSYYRWGATVDPAEPGLTTRPLVGRELTPFGSAASADLVRALDRRLQEGVLEPGAIAPVARLMGAGTVLVRNDLQYERFRTPRPRNVEELLTPTPPGLDAPTGFGPPASIPPRVTTNDEVTLGVPPATPYPPSVETFAVQDPAPIVRTEPAASPLLVAGDGEGLVEAAAAGLLTGPGPVVYSGSAASDPSLVQGALASGADLLLTDTNRRRAQRWGTVRENYGYTERPGEVPLVSDPSDARLPLFPGATDSAFTTAEQRGVSSVMATAYGDPVAYTAADRPAMALDSDPATAWTVAAFDDPRGQKLVVTLAHPVTADHLTLLQPVLPPNERYITQAHLIFDGGPAVPITLDPVASRRVPGETIPFPRATFSQLTFVIDQTNYGNRADFSGVSGVGLAELTIGDPTLAQHVDEVVHLPTDLLGLAGPASAGHNLTVLLARARSNPAEPYKGDEEQAVVRSFSLPAGRAFALSGEARLASAAPDSVLDAVRGQPSVFSASSRLPGDLDARAEMAFDGSPSTAWQSSFGDVNAWVEADAPAPITVDHVDLGIVDDGVHSVPTQLRLSVDGRPGPVLDVPRSGAVHLAFPSVNGSRFRLTVSGLREVTTVNYFSKTPQVTPVSLTEVGLGGLRAPPPPPTIDTGCRPDLLTVDGRPYPVRVTGGTDAADRGQPLAVSPCGPALRLGPGDHLVRAAEGRLTGLNLDRLVLRSAAAAAPAPAGAAPPSAPAVHVTHDGATSVTAKVTGAAGPFWMVLGQSHNAGWHATLAGTSLGASHLVDGYANGWLVRPPPGAAALTIHMTWTPQRRVWQALAASGMVLLLCLLLGFRSGGTETVTSSLPVWRSPWSAELPALKGRTVVAVAGVLAGGAVLAGPGIGVALAVVTAVAAVWPRARVLLTGGAVACVAVIAAYILELQVRYAFPLKLSWPAHFQLVAPLGWAAVGLVVADGVLEWARAP